MASCPSTQKRSCLQSYHWIGVKGIFRYTWGTNDYVIFYEEDGGKSLQLHGFVDVDWADDIHNGNSTCAYLFILF